MSLAGFARFFFALFILAALPALAAEDALSPRQKQAVEEVVREYLLRNPEVLVEAIRAWQARQEAEDREKAQKNLASLRGEPGKTTLPLPLAAIPGAISPSSNFLTTGAGFVSGFSPL